MRVFLDTNIILDLLLERDGYGTSALLFEGQDSGRWKLCVSILTIVNVAYIYRKGVGPEEVIPNLKYLSALVEVLPMNTSTLEESLFLKGRDFEDVLQYVCASAGECDAIVTRNEKDFMIGSGLKSTPRSLPVYSPAAFVKQFV